MPSAPFLALAAAQKIQRGVAGLSALSSASAAGGVATMSLVKRLTGYQKRMKSARQARIMAGRAQRSYRPTSGLYVRGVHRFKRTVTFSTTVQPFTGLNGTGFGMSLSFSLQTILAKIGASSYSYGVEGYTDLTNLFDLWRLDKVAVRAFFANNSSTTASLATCMPLLVYCSDKNDNTPPASTNVMQDQESKFYQFGNGAARSGCLTHMIVPRAHLATGEETTTGTAGTRPEKPGTWIDSASPTVLHYGGKYFYDNMGATQSTSEGSMSWYIDLYFSCKDAN